MSTPDYTTRQSEFKTCTKCGESFPSTREYFSTLRNGLRPYCNSCAREYSKRYYKENADKVRVKDKRWREENADKVRERSKRYREKNPEKVRERLKCWREENPEKIRESQKRYRKENSDKIRAKVRNRRARKRNSEGTHTAADIRLQITAQTDKRGRLRCWWCGKVIKGAYHVDHIIPLAKGGSNGAENICIAHPKCNLSKGAKTPNEFGRLF